MQDPDPSRRNLTILSVSIIIYYWAGGSFDDSSVRLQVVNIHFDNIEVLKSIVWVMLFWFALYYWQTHKRRARNSLLEDVLTLNSNIILIKYAETLLGFKYKIEEGCMQFLRLKFHNNIWSISADKINTTRDGSDGKAGVHHSEPIQGQQIKGIKGNLVISTLYVIASIKGNGFAAYTMPYVFFYTAIFTGLYNKYVICNL